MNGNEPWTSFSSPSLSIDFLCTTHLGIILGQELDDQKSNTSPPLFAALGAMVAVIGTQDRTLGVHYLRTVSIIAQGSTFDTHPRIEWTEAEQEEKNGDVLEAEVKNTR